MRTLPIAVDAPVLTALVAALCAVTGCRGEGPAPGAKASPSPRSVAAGGPTSASGASRVLEPSSELSPILRRLGWEAQNRPHQGVAAERVFEALARADLGVVNPRQYLAATMSASYCAGGATRAGLIVSGCEYGSAAAARAGKQFMDERFAAMTPHARRIVHGGTLLTIAHASSAPPDEVIALATQTLMKL